MVWRVVLSKVATLHEMESSWTLVDVLDAHDALDFKDWVEQQEMKKAKK